ncbi:hypothetical protein [Desulfovibrio subterraneus]|nr:hypothetical protein [Desulfovibrio subterraneus]
MLSLLFGVDAGLPCSMVRPFSQAIAVAPFASLAGWPELLLPYASQRSGCGPVADR